jgi:hypothetical protein
MQNAEFSQVVVHVVVAFFGGYFFYFFYLYLPLAAFSSLYLPLLVKVPKGEFGGFLRAGAGLAEGY